MSGTDDGGVRARYSVSIMRIPGSLAIGLLVLATLSQATAAEPGAAALLKQKVAALDTQLFTAYNRCDLDAFATLFDPDVEFYHDTGGVTHTRQEVIDNTRKYICGKVRRELIAGSLKAYPVKDFGAIAVGEHRFCELATGRCDGIAEFVIVWRESAGAWTATRVLSFGHRSAPANLTATRSMKKRTAP